MWKTHGEITEVGNFRWFKSKNNQKLTRQTTLVISTVLFPFWKSPGFQNVVATNCSGSGISNVADEKLLIITNSSKLLLSLAIYATCNLFTSVSYCNRISYRTQQIVPFLSDLSHRTLKRPLCFVSYIAFNIWWYLNFGNKVWFFFLIHQVCQLRFICTGSLSLLCFNIDAAYFIWNKKIGKISFGGLLFLLFLLAFLISPLII